MVHSHAEAIYQANVSQSTKELLRNKNIVIIGDSVQRSVYKDIVVMLREGRFLTDRELRAKGELSFLGDVLLEGGIRDGQKNGIGYKEARRCSFPTHQVLFYFVTRCYSNYLVEVLNKLASTIVPDVVIMNSCLWDLHRYGEHGPAAFRNNLQTFLHNFATKLPQSRLMWLATLPVRSSCRAGFLPSQTSVQSNEITEANFFASQLIHSYGHTFLNVNGVLSKQLQYRALDGVHWNAAAHRFISITLLSRMGDIWGRPLPPSLLLPSTTAKPNPLPTYTHGHCRSTSLPEAIFNWGNRMFPTYPPPIPGQVMPGYYNFYPQPCYTFGLPLPQPKEKVARDVAPPLRKRQRTATPDVNNNAINHSISTPSPGVPPTPIPTPLREGKLSPVNTEEVPVPGKTPLPPSRKRRRSETEDDDVERDTTRQRSETEDNDKRDLSRQCSETEDNDKRDTIRQQPATMQGNRQQPATPPSTQVSERIPQDPTAQCTQQPSITVNLHHSDNWSVQPQQSLQHHKRSDTRNNYRCVSTVRSGNGNVINFYYPSNPWECSDNTQQPDTRYWSQLPLL